jgi:hypothetical protein
MFIVAHENISKTTESDAQVWAIVLALQLCHSRVALLPGHVCKHGITPSQFIAL